MPISARSGVNLPSLIAGFSQARADYRAARPSHYNSERTGIAPMGASADYHFRTDGEFYKMMERARAFDRDDSLVSAMVNRSVDNVIGEGFRPAPQTGDPEVDRILLDYWDAWSTDSDACDVTGEMVFAEMEQQTYRSRLVDGGVLHLLTQGGAVQMQEGHLCRSPEGASNPRITLGVELDRVRKPLAYWFAEENPGIGNAGGFGQPIRYAARDLQNRRQVLHVYSRSRPSQSRGVSAFTPIFEPMAFYEDIQFAKLLQQQIVSCFAIFRERERVEEGIGGGPPEATGALTEQSDGASTEVLEGLSPGLMVTGKPGEKLHGFSPNTPNAEFFQHVESVLTVVAVNLGMPLMIALMQPQGSYSAYRGALQQAQIGWRRNQADMIRKFHEPVWFWKLDQWADKNGRLNMARATLGPKFYSHIWNRPAWPYIDPQVDTQSGLVRLANGLISPRGLHAEGGRVFKQVATETMEDNVWLIREAKAKAASLNAEFPGDRPIDWREIHPQPVPSGQSVSITPEAAANIPPAGQPAAPSAGGAR